MITLFAPGSENGPPVKKAVIVTPSSANHSMQLPSIAPELSPTTQEGKERLAMAHRFIQYVWRQPQLTAAEFAAMELDALKGASEDSPLHGPPSTLSYDYSLDIKNFATRVFNFMMATKKAALIRKQEAYPPYQYDH